jgi:hypothetical protein
MPSHVDREPKLFDIHDQVRGFVESDKPFSAYGEYCCGILATFDQYGEHKHRATRIPYESSTAYHCSNILFGFSPPTWYKRLTPLGVEKTFNCLNPKNNQSKFGPSLWLNEDDPNVKRRLVTNIPKDRLGKPIFLWLMIEIFVPKIIAYLLKRKKKERKKGPE